MKKKKLLMTNKECFINTKIYLLSNNHLFKLINSCRVTNCNPNPKELGNKPNKPNTINL